MEIERRALTGAWIETKSPGFQELNSTVAPSRARGLKRNQVQTEDHRAAVAPSRARGLKPSLEDVLEDEDEGRALTGAWIETSK